jgi:hypothetical protein
MQQADQSTLQAQPQNIMDWPVPIPDDKLEEQKTPLKPTKVNTEWLCCIATYERPTI